MTKRRLLSLLLCIVLFFSAVLFSACQGYEFSDESSLAVHDYLIELIDINERGETSCETEYAKYYFSSAVSSAKRSQIINMQEKIFSFFLTQAMAKRFFISYQKSPLTKGLFW